MAGSYALHQWRQFLLKTGRVDWNPPLPSSLFSPILPPPLTFPFTSLLPPLNHASEVVWSRPVDRVEIDAYALHTFEYELIYLFRN